jgi:hypothetical protein
VWLCPECASKIAARRAAEVEQVLAHHIAAGGWAVLATLTMRHHRRHGLAQCLDAASAGWQSVNSGRLWAADKVATGFAGYVRALEVTESAQHGWHVHWHAILVFESRPTEDQLDRVVDGMFRRWSSALVRAGMPAPTREHGLDVQHLDADASAPQALAEQGRAWARYLVKGLAAEAVLGVSKDAKGTNRSIRQLMRDALVPQGWEAPEAGEIAYTVDLRARACLAEYEKSLPGRRQLTWSRGRHDLRAAAGLEEELSDEELVEVDLDGEDVAVIPRESWVAIEGRATELLAVTERQGAAGALLWLDEHGVEWWRPTRLTDQRRRGESPGGDRVNDSLPA